MVLNRKCDKCEEPTKRPVGFLDGENASGFIFDCENTKCGVKQLMEATKSEEVQKRIKVQQENAKNRMFAGYIAALRKATGVSMMKMSQIAGVSPAEYSSYEHERKEFDKEAYKKCEEYLKQRR